MQIKAIILTKIKYGEADLIIKLLTADGEIRSVMAKSALRSQKRFGGGVLEPTHYISATLDQRYYNSDSEKLTVLTEAKMIDDFRSLKSDYDRLELALHFVKTVAKVVREGDLHLETFNLLGHSLKAAEVVKNIPMLRMQFNLKLLHLQGVLPPEARFAPFLRSSVRDVDQVGGHEISREDMTHIMSDIDLIYQNYIG